MASRKPALAFILVTLFVDVLGIGLIIPVLTPLIESFVGGTPEAAAPYQGVLISVYALMQFIFSPIIGSLSDRFGRRPVLLISLVGSGLDFLLLAVAPSISWFFVGRIISGITGASIGTASAYIADVSPPEKRAANFGLIGAAFGVGFVAGPLLGGLLGLVNLRLPFIVAAALCLLNALYGLFVLPESLSLENRRAFSWAEANAFGTLKAFAKRPLLLWLSFAMFFIAFAQRGLESSWVLYTQYRYNWGLLSVAVSLTVVGITAAIVQGLLVRRIIPKLGERRSALLGFAIGAVCYTLYGLAPSGWMLYVILPFGSLGGISGPALMGVLSKATPANEQGMLQGGLSSLNSIGAVLAPIAMTSLFGYFVSPSAPVAIPGISFFVGAAAIALGYLIARRGFSRIPEVDPVSSSRMLTAHDET